MSEIPVRIGFVQRALPEYRAPFFDALAEVCPKGLSIFAGRARLEEAIAEGSLKIADYSPAINIHFLRGPFYLYWQGGLLSWLEKWQPEILVEAADPRCLSLPEASHWMHKHKRFVIGWGLGAPPGKGWQKTLRTFSGSRLLKHFDALITYSRKGAGEYLALGVDPEKIFIAPNAVSPRPTWPLPERLPHFQGGQGVVLFVGRLQGRKRVDQLLRACAILPSRLQPRVWIVGDGPERLPLEAFAVEGYPKAEFKGVLHGADLQTLFATADLLVLPGTGGLAIQQGMAFGLPVLVGEADGTQEDLVRPENGWQLHGNSIAALAQGLETALSDPARLRLMGKESYRIVVEEINLENMVQVFNRAVQSLLEG
jgi:glycosyltransferase involved in cell wall biosynthesis